MIQEQWEQRMKLYRVDYVRRRQHFELQLARHNDREQFMVVLRMARYDQEQDILKAYRNRTIDLETLSFQLTALAEACLYMACRFEYHILHAQYGLPESDFYIVGMGKFGGYELSLHSDLDIVFMYECEGEFKESGLTYQEFFAKLAQRVISHLSVLTTRGRAYSIDTELRPSGRSGVLVTSLAGFADYHQRMAQPWEKQALLKARSLRYLTNGLAVEHLIHQTIWDKPLTPEIVPELKRLRIRMERELGQEGWLLHLKVGYGGLVDIEFLVQYLQLVHGAQQPGVRFTHTAFAVRALLAHGLLSATQAETLLAAYQLYREIEFNLRMKEQRAYYRIPAAVGPLWEEFAQAAQRSSGQALHDEFLSMRQRVRGIYEEILVT